MADDLTYMRRALRLATRARGRTAPNPMVGAVIVADGRIVGEGWHHRAGEPHAEVLALRQAGSAAQGATLYCTLEPCCHFGRTPPCAETVIRAGIRRVVVAMGDPFPKVDGGGFARLRDAGLEVECGTLEAEARELNRAYLKAVRTGLPWVTLKMAMTLDGKIATTSGDSRWVSGEASRRYVHRLRDWHDAVMVGIGTALADDPQLTARLPRARQPLRVVVDRRARLSPESYLARTAGEIPTLALVADDAETSHLEAVGVQVASVSASKTGLDLAAALRELTKRGVHSVLCEGGAGLAGGLLDAGLVDEVIWFIAPKLAGGGGPGPVAGRGVELMAAAHQLRDVRFRRIGEDMAVFGYVHRDH